MIRALPEVFRTARLVAQRIEERHLPDLEWLHAESAVVAGSGAPASAHDVSAWFETTVRPHWEQHGYGLFALYAKHAREGAGEAGAHRPFVGRAGLLLAPPGLSEGGTIAEPRVVELDVALVPEARGRGYATEIAGSLTGLALTSLDRRSVVAVVSPDNAVALHVLAKLGYAEERELTRDGARCVLLRRCGRPHVAGGEVLVTT
jgi:RimJ/RimL family protein N-acetyltransferase